MSCLWREPEYQLEKTIPIPEVTDELDHIKYEEKLVSDENQLATLVVIADVPTSTIFSFKLSPMIWLDISTFVNATVLKSFV